MPLKTLKKGQIINLGELTFLLGEVVATSNPGTMNEENVPTGLNVLGTAFVQILNDCIVPGETVYFVPVYNADSAIPGQGTVQIP